MYSYTHFSWVTGEISQAAYVLRNCAERSTLCKFQPQLIVGLPELMADQVSVAHCRCLSWVTFSLYGVILKRPERISAWQLLLFCRLRFSDWSRCRSSVGSSKCLKEVVHNLPSDDASKLKEFIFALGTPEMCSAACVVVQVGDHRHRLGFAGPGEKTQRTAEAMCSVLHLKESFCDFRDSIYHRRCVQDYDVYFTSWFQTTVL